MISVEEALELIRGETMTVAAQPFATEDSLGLTLGEGRCQ